MKNSYIAINGAGYFPVCNKTDVLNVNNTRQCINISYTRNGSFEPGLFAITNQNKQFLMGNKVLFSEYVSPEEFVNVTSKTNKYQPKALFSDKLEIIQINGFQSRVAFPTENILFTPNLNPKTCSKNFCSSLNHNFNYTYESYNFDDIIHLIPRNYEEALENLTSNNFGFLVANRSQANYIQTFDIYDTIGQTHKLEARYKKMGDLKWLMQITVAKESENDLLISNPLSVILADGVLNFNQDGEFLHYYGRLNYLSVQWQNGGYSVIQIFFCKKLYNQEICIRSRSDQNFGYHNIGEKIGDEYQYLTKDEVYYDGYTINQKQKNKYYIDYLGNIYIHGQDVSKKFLYAKIPIDVNKTIENTGLILQGYSNDDLGNQEPLFSLYNQEEYKENSNRNNFLTLERDFFPVICPFKEEILYYKEFNIVSLYRLENEDGCRLLGYKENEDKSNLSQSNLKLFDSAEYQKRVSKTTEINLGDMKINSNVPIIENYNNTDVACNILGGNITSIFPKHLNVSVFDDKGEVHKVSFALVRISGINHFAVEVHLHKNQEIEMLSAGNILVRDDGKIENISSSLETLQIANISVRVNWGAIYVNEKASKILKHPFQKGFVSNKLSKIEIGDDFCIYGTHKNQVSKIFCIAKAEFEFSSDLKKYEGTDFFMAGEQANYVQYDTFSNF